MNHGLNLRTNNTNRITVLSNGNVGIGTNLPLNTLEVFGNNNSANYAPLTLKNNFIFGFNTGAGISVGINFDTRWGGDGFTPPVTMGQINCIKEQNANYGDSYLSFKTRYTSDRVLGGEGVLSEKVRISGIGHVGIGITNPQEKLHVHNGNVTIRNSGPFMQLVSIGGTSSSSDNFTIGGPYTGFNGDKSVYIDNFSGGNIYVRASTTAATGVVLAVNATAWSPYGSDKRIKYDINTISDGLSCITALNPVTFKYKPEDITQKLHYGFIAQEVGGVIPSVIMDVKTPDIYKQYVNNEDTIKTYENEFIIPYLVKSIQELKVLNDELCNRILVLEQKV